MGENKHIEELDVFTKKIIGEIQPESPSIDFTKSIMANILAIENTTLYRATPLISKKIWFVLAVIMAVAVFFVMKGKSIKSYNLPELQGFSMPEIPNLLENIAISNTTLYACLLGTVLLIAQVYWLKNRLIKDI